MQLKPTWEIKYPPNAIQYIDAFRRDVFDYEECAAALHEIFSAQERGVSTVCELGCGTGSNLLTLAGYGYRGTGADASEESVELARQRAADRGLDAEFHLMDFREQLPEGPFDAVVVLFVPLSLGDMRDLAKRAQQIVRPGGLFCCVLLGEDPATAGPELRFHEDAEYVEHEGKPVARFNFYKKEGPQVEFNGIYLVPDDDQRAIMLRDRDHYDLIGDGRQLEVPDGYEHVTDRKLQGGPRQHPPFTYESLEVFRRTD